MNGGARAVSAVLSVVAAAAAAAVLYFGYALYYRDYHAVLLLFSLLLGGVLSSFVCALWHELGHLALGRAAGFRFTGLSVGPLRLARAGKKLRLFIAPSYGLAGAAEMVPVRTEGLRGRYMAFAAGGPLFSLLFLAGTGTAFGFALAGRLHFASYALLCTALPAALYLFFRNALPLFVGSDGAAFADAAKRRPEARAALRLLAAEGGLYAGKTPCELDPQLVFAPAELPEDDVNFLLLCDLRLCFCLGRGDVAAAAAEGVRLEGLIGYAPAYYAARLAADALFCRCLTGERAAADALYGEWKARLARGGAAAARALAAYALLSRGEGKEELAEARRRAAEESTEGAARFEEAALALLESAFARRAAK